MAVPKCGLDSICLISNSFSSLITALSLGSVQSERISEESRNPGILLGENRIEADHQSRNNETAFPNE